MCCAPAYPRCSDYGIQNRCYHVITWYHMIFNIRVKGCKRACHWFFIVVFRAQFGAKGQISARHHHSPAPFGVGLMSLDIARVGHRTAGSTAGSCIDPVFNNTKHIETPFYMSLCYFMSFFQVQKLIFQRFPSLFWSLNFQGFIDGFCHPRSGASVSGPPAMACLNGSIAVPPNMW